jgi:Fe-S cluster biogenesis protein NfuA
MWEKVEAALTKLRPRLRGTNVILIGCNDGTVQVQIVTSFCASGIPEDIALEIVEEQLKQHVPEIKEVVAI